MATTGMDYETQDYKVRDFDGVTVVRLKHANLTGVLEVTRIGEELKAMIDTGVRQLVVDFKHVEHCGSAGLGMLIALHKKLRSLGGRMVVSHPENIEELLRVSNTRSMFATAADPRVAAKMLHA
ncbi:MAG TPA: STAS domain-containing protein [Tepidisphaeraceae bacterium]|jgi:anti-anti-sigma factor